MSYDKFISLKTPAIYHRKQAFFTELVDPAGARHWFGGELGLEVSGTPHGPRPLHRMVTLDLTDDRLGVRAPDDLDQLPLVYGMCFEACALTYLLTSAQRIRLKGGWPQTSREDWPYAGYPDTLPRLGLRLLDPVPYSLDDFGEFTHQGLDLADPDEMIVVVPSTEDYGGVSLWGRYGWGVQIMFYVTLADRTVHVDHQVD